MLLARINLNQLKNVVISQQTRILSLSHTPRAFSTSNWLAVQKENQQEKSEFLQVYYGKIL